MSSTLIITIIFFILFSLYFIKTEGIINGLMHIIYTVVVGIIAYLATTYLLDTGKLIFIICTFTLIALLNYPPTRKYIIKKGAHILDKILGWWVKI